MTKKTFLELLIKMHGLIPKNVHHYRTNGADGQFEVSIGWKGEGVDNNGNTIIEFATPEGFNDAVREILMKVQEEGLFPEYVD